MSPNIKHLRAIVVVPYAVVVLSVAVGQASAAPRNHPKIGMPEARVIALTAFHGIIVKQELEHERGGSGLRYSFDMRRGRSWREVGVDAMTGRVLENTSEGANPKD